MTHQQKEGHKSPIIWELFHQQTPELNRYVPKKKSTNKHSKINISPANQQHADSYQYAELNRNQMTHSTTNSKISFPPVVVKFGHEHQLSINEITDDLILKWKTQHGINLVITARFGHMHSLLIFADDSSTFESLLVSNRWPRCLKDVKIEVKIPRQLPPEYSLVIQQFHRNWDEEEWFEELQQKYSSLYNITRLKGKSGLILNAVRADFRSIDEAKTLIS